ncbi:zinc ribbon domain-containing protein [Streptomyces sp. NPDC054887]
MPLHCPHCGTEVSDDARYCLRCGRERPQPQYGPPVPLEAMETATAPPAGPPPPHHTPPPVFLPAPPAPRRRSPAFVWTATLAAALVIGGGATAGVLLLGDTGDDGGGSLARDDKPVVVTSPTGSAAPGPTAPTTPPEAVPTSSATRGQEGPEIPDAPQSPRSREIPQPPDAPTGYRTVTDPAGFTFAVPEVWSRTNAASGQITYAGSTGMEHILVGVVHNPPYASSYDNFLGIERKARANQRDFRRLRLERNTFHGRPGAIWEYTFTDKQTGETLHAVDQGYIAENGTDYSIYVKSRDRDWQRSREIFDTALSTWTLG